MILQWAIGQPRYSQMVNGEIERPKSIDRSMRKRRSVALRNAKVSDLTCYHNVEKFQCSTNVGNAKSNFRCFKPFWTNCGQEWNKWITTLTQITTEKEIHRMNPCEEKERKLVLISDKEWSHVEMLLSHRDSMDKNWPVIYNQVIK